MCVLWQGEADPVRCRTGSSEKQQVNVGIAA